MGNAASADNATCTNATAINETALNATDTTPHMADNSTLAEFTTVSLLEATQLLQNALGKDVNIIFIGFGMTLVYALLAYVQRFLEDILFVQILLSVDTKDSGQHRREHDYSPGMEDSPDLPRDVRSSMKQAKDQEELIRGVRAFAAYQSINLPWPFAWICPLPEYSASTSLGASVIYDDGEVGVSLPPSSHALPPSSHAPPPPRACSPKHIHGHRLRPST